MTECDYEDCEEPALRDSEHCIFHKPDKDEIAAKGFYKLIRQEAREPEGEVFEDGLGDEKKRLVFEKELKWRGYQFPGKPKSPFKNSPLHLFRDCIFQESVKLQEATIKAGVVFRNTTFEESAHLDGATFEDVANFGATTFKGRTTFKNVTFGGEVYFEDSTFSVDAYFNYSTFYGDAHFCASPVQGTPLINAKFSGFTSFAGCKFKSDALFGGVEFSSITSFESTKIEGDANFRKSTFEKDVRFNRAQLYKATIFKGADFKGESEFDSTYLRGRVNLEDADFFDKCTFRNAHFASDLILENSYFERRVNFIDSLEELNGKTNLLRTNVTDSLSILTKLTAPAYRIEIEFKEGTSEIRQDKSEVIKELEKIDKSDNEISKIGVFVEKFTQPQAKVEGCREQRLTYEARGQKEEADQVFVHEMRARRQLKGSISRFFDWLIADFTCKYGTSWEQVLRVSVGMMVVFGFLYHGIELGVNNLNNFLTPNLGESFYQSAVVFTTLGYDKGFFTGNPLLKAMSAVESVFGALLVALIIIVFARKWMRS